MLALGYCLVARDLKWLVVVMVQEERDLKWLVVMVQEEEKDLKWLVVMVEEKDLRRLQTCRWHYSSGECPV